MENESDSHRFFLIEICECNLCKNPNPKNPRDCQFMDSWVDGGSNTEKSVDLEALHAVFWICFLNFDEL